VSPPASPLKDDLLHTGDPCPNRRGLSELGFAARTPAEVLADLAGRQAALLVGERVAELVGRDGLAALPSALRLCVFDAHALDVPCAGACVGVPTVVERSGTFVNIDGRRGPIAAARPPPPGVALLASTLGRLTALLARAEVAG
jgi:hypothetical protein